MSWIALCGSPGYARRGGSSRRAPWRIIRRPMGLAQGRRRRTGGRSIPAIGPWDANKALEPSPEKWAGFEGTEPLEGKNEGRMRRQAKTMHEEAPGPVERAAMAIDVENRSGAQASSLASSVWRVGVVGPASFTSESGRSPQMLRLLEPGREFYIQNDPFSCATSRKS